MGLISGWWARLKKRGPVPTAVDVASLVVPVPATLRSGLEVAWESYRARKEAEALKLLAHELRQAHLTVDDLVARHETAAMVFMLLRAAIEGAARINLRILAKALRGYTVRGETEEERYARLIEIIKFMSRKELVVLAALHDACRELSAAGWNDGTATVTTERAVAKKLVPSIIESDAELRAVMGALTRTGFVAVLSTYGALAFVTTPLAKDAVVLASLKEALAEEVGEPFFAP